MRNYNLLFQHMRLSPRFRLGPGTRSMQCSEQDSENSDDGPNLERHRLGSVLRPHLELIRWRGPTLGTLSRSTWGEAKLQ